MRKISLFMFFTLVVCLAVGLSGVASPQKGKKGGGGGGKKQTNAMKVEISPPIAGTDTDPLDAEVGLDAPSCFGVMDIADDGKPSPIVFKDTLVDGFAIGGVDFTCLYVTLDTRPQDNAIEGVYINFRGGRCRARDLNVETDVVPVSAAAGGVAFPSLTGFSIPIDAHNLPVPGGPNPLGEVSMGTFWVSPCPEGEDCSKPSCP